MYTYGFKDLSTLARIHTHIYTWGGETGLSGQGTHGYCVQGKVETLGKKLRVATLSTGKSRCCGFSGLGPSSQSRTRPGLPKAGVWVGRFKNALCLMHGRSLALKELSARTCGRCVQQGVRRAGVSSSSPGPRWGFCSLKIADTAWGGLPTALSVRRMLSACKTLCLWVFCHRSQRKGSFCLPRINSHSE